MSSKKIRHEVFCSFKILKKYFEDYPSLMLSSDDEKSQNALNWRKLLFNNSDVVLDISEEEAEKYYVENDLFKYLYKASVGGKSRLVFEKDFIKDCIINKRYSEFISPIFIIDKNNDDCQDIENSFGVIALNYDRMLGKGKQVFYSNTINISKKAQTIKSWDDMQELKHTCNSMIIIRVYTE